jgi:hypothetical protein
MHQNMSLGSNGMDRVLSLRKIPIRLRGTNFCTSSARFAPSFVRQPNGPKCTQTVRNAPKHMFRVQWGLSGAFVAKNSDELRGTKFCTSSARFAPSFVRKPHGPKCTQMVRNSPKHEFRVQWGGSGAFVVKTTNYCTSSARFAPSFVRNQMVPNTPKLYEMQQSESLGFNGVDWVCSSLKSPTRLRGTKFCTS